MDPVQLVAKAARHDSVQYRNAIHMALDEVEETLHRVDEQLKVQHALPFGRGGGLGMARGGPTSPCMCIASVRVVEQSAWEQYEAWALAAA